MSFPKSIWLLLAAFCLSLRAGAQALPAATMAPHLSIFGDLSANTSNYNPDSSHYGTLYGATLGAHLQTRPWLGLEARASFLESNTQGRQAEHEKGIYFGPRGLFIHRRLRVDGLVLGGIAHSAYPAFPLTVEANGQDLFRYSTRPALDVGGGVDFWLNPRLSWRTGEVMYNHVFGAREPEGVSFSTGLIVRIF
ncbi:MAG TPA: hypothetical protein VHX11_02935 [Acidobacteriaceae bacterium]|jgi:hypothetical protein|nr:hypothetical protein [Acidobacteriaceae bacterium]